MLLAAFLQVLLSPLCDDPKMVRDLQAELVGQLPHSEGEHCVSASEQYQIFSPHSIKNKTS